MNVSYVFCVECRVCGLAPAARTVLGSPTTDKRPVGRPEPLRFPPHTAPAESFKAAALVRTTRRPEVRKRDMSATGRSAFTLVELLVVVSIMGILLAALLPGLRDAREQARAVVCGSNIRQLAVANTAYATEHGGRFCPGAAGMQRENLQRWYGARSASDEPFDAVRGPLAPFLGFDEGIRACPSFRRFVDEPGQAFERGGGGYGYNQAYLGRVLSAQESGSFAVVTDAYGVLSERVSRPGATVMFSDAAFAAVAEGVIEYSFAEPRFHPEFLHFQARMDPSVHFRHRGKVNVAWCDGHVHRRTRTFTWHSGLYRGDPRRQNLGWFGDEDDNGYFDLR